MDLEPKLGEVWNVKPWWSKVAQIPCKITSIWKASPLIDVQPLEGNPHARTIREDLLIDRIGGHPAETCQ